MVKIPSQLILVAFAVVLTGCSSSLIEQLPEGVGRPPADAPSAPQTPYQYPAVHDLPPPQGTKPMSDEELRRAENALKTARDRQEKLQKALDTGKTADE